jgi:hypothetical protein
VVFVDCRSDRLIRPVAIHEVDEQDEFRVSELRYEVQSKICGVSVIVVTITTHGNSRVLKSDRLGKSIFVQN